MAYVIHEAYTRSLRKKRALQAVLVVVGLEGVVAGAAAVVGWVVVES